jgi:hypothetical protein
MNGPVQEAPEGVFAAEHGVNTTSEPDNEYSPSPATVFVVNVQPVGGESVEQNRIVAEARLFPEPATSFASTSIVCGAP